MSLQIKNKCTIKQCNDVITQPRLDNKIDHKRYTKGEIFFDKIALFLGTNLFRKYYFFRYFFAHWGQTHLFSQMHSKITHHSNIHITYHIKYKYGLAC